MTRSLFAALALLAALLFGPAALAQTADSPAVVRVPGGSFEETAPGQWVEYDRDRTRRYTFGARESGNTTVLTNPAMGVTLWLDRDARAVFAQWPGQPRHRLHTITGIDDMMFPPPKARPRPAPPAPRPPAPEPPAVKPPPAKPSAPATPATVQVVRASGDHVFRRDLFDVFGWSETRADGTTGRLRQIGTEGSRLYLLGADDRLVVIDLAREAVLGASGEGLSRLHAIQDAATERDAMVSPNPPSIPAPGTLPEPERAACEATGGTVERAGIMGAERCTRPYPDAGLFCTDSDVCAGSCIATPEARMGERVAGTCQATDNPFGCYARVEDGRATPALCVD